MEIGTVYSVRYSVSVAFSHTIKSSVFVPKALTYLITSPYHPLPPNNLHGILYFIVRSLYSAYPSHLGRGIKFAKVPYLWFYQAPYM